MTDEEKKKPGAAFWATVVVVCLLLAGYPLSIGPANWLLRHGMLPEQTHPALTTFYRPIDFTCDNSETIADTMRWYVSLWVD
jgi:hypothetical protein